MLSFYAEDERERFWIKELDCLSPNGYNILEGGQGLRREPLRCKDCGAQIGKGSKRCKECAAKAQQKVNLTLSDLELAQLIKENGFSGVGKMYGCSDNSVRRWCIRY